MEHKSRDNGQYLWFAPEILTRAGTYSESVSYVPNTERFSHELVGRPTKYGKKAYLPNVYPFHHFKAEHLSPRTMPNGRDDIGCFFPHDYGAITPHLESAKHDLILRLRSFSGSVTEMCETAFPPQIDLITFMAELGELVWMVTSLPRTFAEVLRTVAAGYLTLELAWKPFLSDLAKLVKIASRIQARYKYLRTVNNRGWTRTRFRLDSSKLGTIASTVSAPALSATLAPYNGGVPVTYDSVVTGELCIGGYLRWHIDPVELDRMVNGYSAIFQSLGLYEPLVSFWNQVELSFVLDWIGPIVHDLFELISWDPLEGSVDARSFTSSVKTQAQYVPSCISPLPSVDFERAPEMVKRATLVITDYERWVGLPQVKLDPSDIITPWRASILAALAVVMY